MGEIEETVDDIIEKLWLVDETNGDMKQVFSRSPEEWKAEYDLLTPVDKTKLLIKRGKIQESEGNAQLVAISLYGMKHVVSIANDGGGTRLSLRK